MLMAMEYVISESQLPMIVRYLKQEIITEVTLGYRNLEDNSTIMNDGAINIVVDRWINRTSTNTSSNFEKFYIS